MINYKSEFHSIQVTAPSGGVVGGTPVKIGSHLFGVPAATAAAGYPVNLITAGVFNLSKAGTFSITAGDKLYWNSSTGITKTATDYACGVAMSDAASAATSCEVLIFPMTDLVAVDAAIAALDVRVAALEA